MNKKGRWIAVALATVMIMGVSVCIEEDDDEKKKRLTYDLVARMIDAQLGEISDGTDATCNPNDTGNVAPVGEHCKNQLFGEVSQSTIVQYVQINSDTVLFGGDNPFYMRGFVPQTNNPCEESLDGDSLEDYKNACYQTLTCQELADGYVRLTYDDCDWQEHAKLEGEVIATGNGGAAYSGTLANTLVRPGYLVITAYNQTARDDGNGNLVGDVASGTINYATGAFSVTFSAAVGSGVDILADYQHETNKWWLEGIVDFYYGVTPNNEHTVLIRASNFAAEDQATGAAYAFTGDIFKYTVLDPVNGEPLLGTTGRDVDGMTIVRASFLVDMDGVLGPWPSNQYRLYLANDNEDGWVFLYGSYSAVWLGKEATSIVDPADTTLTFYQAPPLAWNYVGTGCFVDISNPVPATRTFNIFSQDRFSNNGCIAGATAVAY